MQFVSNNLRFLKLKLLEVGGGISISFEFQGVAEGDGKDGGGSLEKVGLELIECLAII